MWLWEVIFHTLWLRFYHEHIGQCGFDPNVNSVAVPIMNNVVDLFFFFFFYRFVLLNLTAIRLPFGRHSGSDIPSLRVDLTCAVFSYIRRLLWLPMLGIFDVHKDVDARDCTPNTASSVPDPTLNPLSYIPALKGLTKLKSAVEVDSY